MRASIFQALFSLFSFPKNKMKIFPEYQGRIISYIFIIIYILTVG